MLAIASAVLSLLSCRLRSRISMELEIVALRHQLTVLRRQRPGRPRLLPGDRMLWASLYWLWPSRLNAMFLVKPTTVVQWHRQGFRRYGRWRSRCRGRGRPAVAHEIRDLIREMSRANPLWGAPRIHGELLKLGISIGRTAVSKYMAWRRRAPSPSWRTFLRNQRHGIAAIDMFVVATATFRLLYVMVILRHARRKIVRFGVTEHPGQDWVSQQVTEAFPWDAAPRYLLRDRDGTYGQRFHERVQAMGIEEVITTHRSPWQNSYAERLIGSVRRECLDHVIVINQRRLRRVLSSHVDYHHRSRSNLALEKDCPEGSSIHSAVNGNIIAIPQVGGLPHRYERLAA